MSDTPQFIGAYQLEDISICDDLILYHENHKQFSKKVWDDSIKESTDVLLRTEDKIFYDYYKQLMIVVGKYLEDYPKAGGASRWAITEHVGIQWYPVGGGYKVWHCERQSGHGKIGARHLVFMTYLNDVEDGGTEFFHQNWTCDAKKGMTLIWPTDWTFTHRSQVSKTKEKYVTTGWFSHVE